MANSEELLVNINAAYDAMHDVSEQLLEIKEELLETPCVASSALETAQAALPKTGGTLTGDLAIDATLITLQKHNSVGFSTLRFTDKDSDGEEIPIGACQNVWAPTASFTRQLLKAFAYKDDGSKVESTVEAVAYKDGTVCGIAPHPRANNYGTDIVTMKTLKDTALLKSQSVTGSGIEIFVGNLASASDTADLHTGRGSREKPFLSLGAAVAFAANQYSGTGAVTFRLLTDIDFSESEALYMPLDPISCVCSDDAENPVTVNVTKNFAFGSGNWVLGDLKIHGLDTAQNLIFCSGFSRFCRILINEPIQFSGKAAQAVIGVYWGGRVNLYPGVQLTGNPTGKKYLVDQLSQLYAGGVTIPGTLAGEVKTGSTFA